MPHSRLPRAGARRRTKVAKVVKDRERKAAKRAAVEACRARRRISFDEVRSSDYDSDADEAKEPTEGVLSAREESDGDGQCVGRLLRCHCAGGF